MFEIKPVRLLLTIVALIVATMATDFLIHAVMTKPDYDATKEVWRPEAEMKALHMMIGQILTAVAFGMLYARGFATGQWLCAIIFGIVMGLFQSGFFFVFYAVLPITTGILIKWLAGAIAQGLVLAVIAKLVYQKGVPESEFVSK